MTERERRESNGQIVTHVHDIIYYDNSHLNYIYKEKLNGIEYTFYGFFKDNFFVIVLDSFNESLEIK